MKKSDLLDFKNWKHVKSDDKSTTLQHKKHSHVLTIAHNVLGPKDQAALKALAGVSKEAETPQQAQEAQDQNPRMADGGEVSDGGDETTVIPDRGYGKIIWIKNKGGVIPHDNPGPDNLTYNKGGEAISNDPKQQPMSMPNFDEGTPDGTVGDQADIQAQDQTQSQVPQQPEEPIATRAGKKLRELIVNDPHVREADAALKTVGHLITHDAPNFISGLMGGQQDQNQSKPQIQAPAQSDQSQSQQPQQPQQAQQDQGPAPIDQAMQQSQNLLEQGYQQQIAGMTQEAQAKGQLGQQQANQIEQNLNAQNAARAAFQQSFQALDNERQGIMNDIQEGHINPEQFWIGDKDGNGGHSKIMTGLGIILAGFNPTNNPNAALNFLKFQMEQNLQAQAKNLDSKNNLLMANIQQFGNLRDAADMTRLQQADILQNQMLMAAGKAATPMARAEMLQKAGQLEMNYAPLRQQFAMRQAMMKMANSNNPSDMAGIDHMINYMSLTNPEMAKQYKEAYVPGVGLSRSLQPIPDNVRSQIVSTKQVNDLMNRSLDFSAAHHGSLDPKTRAAASTIQNQLIGVIKQAQHDGVYKPSEAEFLLSQIGGSPASFMANFSSVPKIKELQQIKNQEYNELLKAHNLPQQQLPQSQGRPQYKTVNGVRYMRGPNGEAIPVK